MEPVKSRRVIFYDQDKKVTILIITSSHKIKNPLEAPSRPDRAFNCGNVLSFVANKASHPSEDGKRSEAAVTQEAEPITAQRRRELEHYLKLKRYTTATVCLNRVSHNYNQPPDFQCISFSFFLVRGGCKTGAASGSKTRMWSLIRMRRSLLRLTPYLQATERTKNCGKHRLTCTTVVRS